MIQPDEAFGNASGAGFARQTSCVALRQPRRRCPTDITLIDAVPILTTLTQVAERHGDPTVKVYARLFELHPEFERLFALDRDGGVRASMLQTCIECIIGTAEQKDTARYVIEAARLHHAGYGVPEEQLDLMFVAMRDVFRGIIGADWTPAMETEWTALLAALGRGA